MTPRVGAYGGPQELFWIHGRHIEFGEAIGFFAGRRLLEDEALVLIDVGGGLLGCADEFVFCHS
jgi:hypothetical protein